MQTGDVKTMLDVTILVEPASVLSGAASAKAGGDMVQCTSTNGRGSARARFQIRHSLITKVDGEIEVEGEIEAEGKR